MPDPRGETPEAESRRAKAFRYALALLDERLKLYGPRHEVTIAGYIEELTAAAASSSASGIAQIREELSESLRTRLLFGNYDEPIDDAGSRLIRVILSKFALVSGDACGQDTLQQNGGRPAGENRSELSASGIAGMERRTIVKVEAGLAKLRVYANQGYPLTPREAGDLADALSALLANRQETK